MTKDLAMSERGMIWFRALTAGGQATNTGLSSLRVARAMLGGEPACFLAVVPDANNRFPRARGGEVGLDEGWGLALQLRRLIGEAARPPCPIIAIVDVVSQAYGWREELLGIHLACAAAADAYASARLAGHPVVALLVGKAMSGAFLAHGYQANRILALDSSEVQVHAMGKEAAARVTRRSVAELEALGARIPPMAYDIRSFNRLGLLHKLVRDVNADSPTSEDVSRVQAELIEAVVDIRAGPADLSNRLTSSGAHATRSASIEVRRRLREQWDA